MTITPSKQLPSLVSVESIYRASVNLKQVVDRTPLMLNTLLSDQYDCHLLLKREDLQRVRSYKIRGAYHRISGLSKEEQKLGIVCASAGNHAQGVALACAQLKIEGKVFMPSTTPRQKIDKVRFFGKDYISIELIGDTYDDAYMKAREEAEITNKTFIHPFNDEAVIEGQGTVGLEIIEDSEQAIDYIFVPIGGGGLASGLGSYFRQMSPNTKIIGVEPAGAPAMFQSFQQGSVIRLNEINPFVDGAAVRQIGDRTFGLCQRVLDDIVLVPEGKVCSTILKLYNEDAIVVEPAGALAVAAIDQYADKLKGKNVVCVVSGGNNDITRMEDIKEKALLHEGLKHYFIVRFPQRAGALREFLNNVLGPDDDITHFSYTKKVNRDSGPALVGIELKDSKDYESLVERMKTHQINFQIVNDDPMLFELLV